MGEKNLIIGFEFGEKESQIGIYDRKESDAVSVPVKQGSVQSTFATCLSKKRGSDEWHFGPEAYYFSSQQNEIYLDDLYQACMKGESRVLEGRTWLPEELLAVFLRQSLRLAGVTDICAQVSALMITTAQITRELVETVRRACESLQISGNRYFLQNYEESFYYYTMYQRPELYSRKVGMFLFENNQVSFWKLDMNVKVKPTLVKIEKTAPVELPETDALRDEQYCRYAQEALGADVYSTIFLVGGGFDRSWAKDSLLFLCRHRRRVFMGNNLYVKGACFAAKEKVEDRMLKGYLFVSDDMVRINIGMDMVINGSPAYYPLIPAGINWYEAVRDVRILLDGAQMLEFLVSNMEDGQKNRYCMALPSLPKRPAKATRLHLHLEFITAEKCRIQVRDEGFGEMFPASDLCWEEVFTG